MPPYMTKADVLRCLDEIGHRFAETADDDLEHYKALGVAFGVAYHTVMSMPDTDVELRAGIVERLTREGTIRKRH